METQILHAHEIVPLIDPPRVIDAIAQAYQDFYRGKIQVPFPIQTAMPEGGAMHHKMAQDGEIFVTKIASYAPGNAAKDLENIQGMMVVHDAVTGVPRAIYLDRALLTHHRTAAAGAVGARYLSRPDSRKVLMVGSGRQAELQLDYLRHVRPIEEVVVHSAHAENAAAFVERMREQISSIQFSTRSSLEEAIAWADIIVTATPSRGILIPADSVVPGTHINAIGSDGPGKQELDPRLLVRARYVTDSTAQCAQKGELQHAIRDGLLTVEDVHAEMGAIVAGDKEGRTSPEQITIFDSTGLGAQDLGMVRYMMQRNSKN